MKTAIVPIEQIILPPERQRSSHGGSGRYSIDDLAASIRQHGQLQPIGVTNDFTLVYGGRRLDALEQNNSPTAWVCFVDSLSPDELMEIEFVENYYRADLPWQDECQAILKFHRLKQSTNPEWSLEDTAKRFILSVRTVGNYLEVAQELATSAAVQACKSIGEAYNILERKKSRAVDIEMEDFEDDEPTPGIPLTAEELAAVGLSYPTKDRRVESEADSIVQADFKLWAPEFKGRRFNFIHCDFPYGVGMDQSDQGSYHAFETYEDTKEIFWDLVETLITNKDRLFATSSHLMMWFSMNDYWPLFCALADAGFKVNPFPLIWYKSDSTGILPDPQRGPRRVYETALMASLGDRKIVRPVNNLFAWSANKAQAKHHSEKPEPVVSHFLTMFVDKTTIMLDPTCGSGTALVAAEGKWAEHVQGLDISITHVQTATRALKAKRLAKLGQAGGEDEMQDDGAGEG